jgi:hypothetical protein
MIFQQLIGHKWKKTVRSAAFRQGCLVQVLLIFVGGYFLLSFISLGLLMPEVLASLAPGIENPVQGLMRIFLYYFLTDLVVRFFFEGLNTVEVRHYQLLPIRKETLVHFVLSSTVFNFLNLLILSFIIPYAIVGVWGQVSFWYFLTWILTILLWIGVSNYLVIWIKRKSLSWAPLTFIFLGTILLIFSLGVFGVFSMERVSLAIFGWWEWRFPWLLPAVILYFLYILNFRLLLQSIRNDTWQQSGNQTYSPGIFSFLEKGNPVSMLLSQELKLIWRNKRTRMTVWTMGLFLLYGLLFYPKGDMYAESSGWTIFLGIFITGMFMINYGQFMTAWESAHFDRLMTLRISIREYFKAKWWLLVGSALLGYILALPYGWFGGKIILMHTVCLVFNVGFTSFFLLYSSTYNQKRIDLSRSNMMNYQGMSSVQWLITIPILGLPYLIVMPFSVWGYEMTGIWLLIGFSVISLAGASVWFKIIEESFVEKKYKKTSGFRQN